MYFVTGSSPSAFAHTCNVIIHPVANQILALPIFVNNLGSVVRGEGVRQEWHPGMFGGHEGGEGSWPHQWSTSLESQANETEKQHKANIDCKCSHSLFQGHYECQDCSSLLSEMGDKVTFRAAWDISWPHQQSSSLVWRAGETERWQKRKQKHRFFWFVPGMLM